MEYQDNFMDYGNNDYSNSTMEMNMDINIDMGIKQETVDSPQFSEASSSSSTSSSPAVIVKTKTAKGCPVCGENAYNKHFGVLCCNAW